MFRKLSFLSFLILILLTSTVLAASKKDVTPDYMIQDIETATSDPANGFYTIYAGMPIDEFKANWDGIPGWVTIQENHSNFTNKNGRLVTIDNYRLGKSPQPPYVVIVECPFRDGRLQNGLVSFNFVKKTNADDIYQRAVKNFICALGEPDLRFPGRSNGEVCVWHDKKHNAILSVSIIGPFDRLKPIKKTQKGAIPSSKKEPSHPVDDLFYHARYSVFINSKPYDDKAWKWEEGHERQTHL